MYLILSQGFVSFQFHFYFFPTPASYFITCPAVFHSDLISGSLLPSYLFHCLPSFISFLFLCCPATDFIACLALFLFHFFAAQLFISLPAQLYFFLFLCCPAT
jgi:hypothetical protein